MIFWHRLSSTVTSAAVSGSGTSRSPSPHAYSSLFGRAYISGVTCWARDLTPSRKSLGKEMEVKMAYAEVGLLGRIVTEWARTAEIGALSRRHIVQGPAARTTSVAVTLCMSFESFAVYEIE